MPALTTNPATPEPHDEPRAVAADTANVQQRAWGGEMDERAESEAIRIERRNNEMRGY